MHYFWLKKKWFFDIIVNNLLFAFVLTMPQYDFDIDSNVNYAEVAPFEGETTEVEVLNFWGSAGISTIIETGTELAEETLDLDYTSDLCTALEFVLDAYFYTTGQYIKPVAVIANPSKIDIIEYRKEVFNKARILPVVEAVPKQDIELFEIKCPNFDVDTEVLGTLDFSLDTIEYSNAMDFASSLDFEITNTYEFATSNLYAKIDNDATIKLEKANIIDFSFSNIAVFFTNINARFYTPVVLELKMSNVQLENIEIYNTMDVTDYVTRFADLEGLIVEDLTGKKFRDLRNLNV